MKSFAVALGVSLACAACYGPLDTAPSVDQSQMTGTWFEIAHLPLAAQKGCIDTTATYTPLTDGHFSVIHQCTLANGAAVKQAATLYDLGDTTHAKLGIDLGGFIGDYWITDVASDYRYMVVGHPSRNYFWILARQKTLAQSDLDAILARAQNEGFDTSKLVYTQQN
jgi:apolipoprotein D and lipocalin family protein